MSIDPLAAAGVRRAAVRAYPAEACGLLLGRRGEGRLEVHHAVPGRNLAPGNVRDAFVLEPDSVPRAGALAEVRGLEVVGTFHSHPDSPAVPSARDVSGAPDGWLVLIVPVRGALGGARPGAACAFIPGEPGGQRGLVALPLTTERVVPQGRVMDVARRSLPPAPCRD